MQDIHTIGVGGGGRLFGGGERRVRPHHHHQGHGVGQSPKCPRCDSVNTKFCYYNNYNLSQPRHFCKSCRRYWTKGGVLRNVPVGGGCRKAKRSSKNIPSDHKKKDNDDDNSQSSSESSSLTASAVVTENVSDYVPPLSTPEASSPVEQIHARSPPPKILDFSQGMTNPILDSMTSFSDPSEGCDIGSFSSMMTSSSNPMMSFDYGYRLPLQSDGKVIENQSSTNQQWTHQHETTTTTMPEELKMQDISGGYLDPTVEIDMSGRHHGGLETLDQELFGDLTATVDQTYWNQSQWNDVNEHTLYLP